MQCRKMMIACIMATEMKVHVALCSRLESNASMYSETGVFPYNADAPSDREQAEILKSQYRRMLAIDNYYIG